MKTRVGSLTVLLMLLCSVVVWMILWAHSREISNEASTGRGREFAVPSDSQNAVKASPKKTEVMQTNPLASDILMVPQNTNVAHEPPNAYMSEVQLNRQVSPWVQLIAAKDFNTKAYQEKYKAVQELDEFIHPKEVEYLLQYLEDPETARQDNLWDLAIKNDVLQKLVNQRRLHPQLLERMVGMIHNKEHGIVWRDYVMQYFHEYVRQVVVENKEVLKPEELESISSTLEEIVKDAEHSMPGTALINLDRIAKMTSNDDLNKKKQVLAEKILANKADYSEASVITALALRDGDSEALKTQMSGLLADSGVTINEKLVALGRLWDSGVRPDDLEIPDDLSTDPRFKNFLTLRSSK